jgi:hypothetical protein
MSYLLLSMIWRARLGAMVIKLRKRQTLIGSLHGEYVLNGRTTSCRYAIQRVLLF